MSDRKTLTKTLVAACRERLERESELWPHASPEERKHIVRAHVAGMVADYSKSQVTTEFYPLVTAGAAGLHATSSACCAVKTGRGLLVEVLDWEEDTLVIA